MYFGLFVQRWRQALEMCAIKLGSIANFSDVDLTKFADLNTVRSVVEGNCDTEADKSKLVTH